MLYLAGLIQTIISSCVQNIEFERVVSRLIKYRIQNTDGHTWIGTDLKKNYWSKAFVTFSKYVSIYLSIYLIL